MMYPVIEEIAAHHRSLPTKDEPLRVLELGPGLCLHAGEANFVPEYFELRAVLADTATDLTVVDHNPAVIDAVKTNRTYYLPKGYSKNPAFGCIKRMAQQEQQEQRARSKHQHRRELTLDFSSTQHRVNFVNADFTAIALPPEHFDVIVALNCLFYLLENPAFKGHYGGDAFLRKLINSLKRSSNTNNGPGPAMFVDKDSFVHIEELKRKAEEEGSPLDICSEYIGESEHAGRLGLHALRHSMKRGGESCD